MKTRLYLVRHGESEDNVAGRFGGHRDVALTTRGERQAEALAQRLAQEPIDAILSSSLLRAKQTAELVALRRGMHARVVAGWEEADFGAWEGLTYEQALDKYPKEVRAWSAAPLTASPPGGESFEAVYQRVRKALDSLLTEYEGRSVLLVAHGGPIRAALALTLRAPMSVALHLMVDPCALTIIDDYDGDGVVVTMNETTWRDEGRR